MTLEETLVGTHIQRVAMLAPNLIGLELYARGVHGALLLGLGGTAHGVGWIDGKLRGATTTPPVTGLKTYVLRGRITALEREELRWCITIAREGKTRVLEARFGPGHPQLTLRDEAGAQLLEIRAAAAPQGERESFDGLTSLDALRARGRTMLVQGDDDALKAARAAALVALRNRMRRVVRTLQAIDGDLARSVEIPRLRRDAGLILSHLHALAPNAREVSVPDLSADPEALVELRFDPELGPKQQAEAWFRRARRLERGMAIATQRAAVLREELAQLREREGRVESAASLAELEAQSDDRVTLPKGREEARARAVTEKGERLPYREFRSRDRAIWVGRGAADNDRLSLHHAKPHDLWLHARDQAGAHVIVPLSRTEACPPELLVDAATLAVHFSGERGEAVVDVLYTPRRFLRKPRNAAPGAVVPMREKVLRLRMEPERLQRLLASERRKTGG